GGLAVPPLPATSPMSHSLQYVYSGTSGIRNLPEFMIVGLVDGEPFVYYDSNIRRMTPRQDWMAKSEGPDYWDRNTNKSRIHEQVYKANIETAKRSLEIWGAQSYPQRAGVYGGFCCNSLMRLLR
uniref:MHC class I-like antigen recognition-like domain-containing protein n=1 Tax=Paramormyrops kingsleyae TaxID=1676925 RepID=A0A3B3Q3R7_9TELE